MPQAYSAATMQRGRRAVRAEARGAQRRLAHPQPSTTSTWSSCSASRSPTRPASRDSSVERDPMPLDPREHRGRVGRRGARQLLRHRDLEHGVPGADRPDGRAVQPAGRRAVPELHDRAGQLPVGRRLVRRRTATASIALHPYTHRDVPAEHGLPDARLRRVRPRQRDAPSRRRSSTAPTSPTSPRSTRCSARSAPMTSRSWSTWSRCRTTSRRRTGTTTRSRSTVDGGRGRGSRDRRRTRAAMEYLRRRPATSSWRTCGTSDEETVVVFYGDHYPGIFGDAAARRATRASAQLRHRC